MPDLITIKNKLANTSLKDLKIYPQNAADDIDTMLNTVLTQMWTDISNNTLTDEEIDWCMDTFAKAIITNLIDKQAQKDLNELFSTTLAAYSSNYLDLIYVLQLIKKHNMPIPGPAVVYIPEDISAAAKTYDVNHTDVNKSALLANIGAYYSTATALFVLMDDDDDLKNFKMYANTMLSKAGVDLIPDDFSINNKIFDGIIIRNDFKLMNDENNPNSCARVLAEALFSNYLDVTLPSKLIESIMPSTIVFFNAKKLSRATLTEIQNASQDINKLAMLDKSRILSFKAMASLSQIQRQMTKQAMMANQLNNLLAKSSIAQKAGKFVIKDINMDRVKKKLMSIERKMKNKNITKNPKLYFTDSFQRPNRREPDNYDLPGIVQDFGYYPDIHLYVDTSGSISQEDYEDSVAMIIDIAKKLNCDIYFNSFTTDISQEAVVRCRNRSPRQIQKDIENIPKLSGGTTIDQVWSYINATHKNRSQLSVLISDFYVDVPRYIKHPANLYYIPTKGTSVSYAQEFANRLPNPYRVLF